MDKTSFLVPYERVLPQGSRVLCAVYVTGVDSPGAATQAIRVELHDTADPTLWGDEGPQRARAIHLRAPQPVADLDAAALWLGEHGTEESQLAVLQP